MGDRALVIFKSGKYYSPGTYLHWAGDPEEVMKLLKICGEGVRKGDPSYSAAHFCGVCYRELDAVQYGLGLFNTTEEDAELLLDGSKKALDKLAGSAGCDNGLYIVDTNTGEVIQIPYGGKVVNHGKVELGKY